MEFKCEITKSESYVLDWQIDNYCEYEERRDQELVTQRQDENGEPLPFQAKISYEWYSHINIFCKSRNNVTLKSLQLVQVGDDELIDESHTDLKADKWRRLLLLPNFGNTNLHLRFSFIINTKYKDNAGTELPITKDLGTLVMNSAFSDVTVKTSEGEEIPAHKVLLVSRSAVFRALFDHDTVEKSTNLVESPFPTDIVNDLLCYIYTDTANNIDKTAPGLLVAADYYHLDGLKVLCEDELVKSLNIKNAVDILSLAITHHADRLKEKALEFVKNVYNAPKIIKTDAWKSLQLVELAKSIYEFNL